MATSSPHFARKPPSTFFTSASSPTRPSPSTTPRRAPRQTAIASFLTAPSPSPIKKSTTPRKPAPTKSKNASLLTFFKPIPKDGKKNRADHRCDELFLSTGGYELDLSEPEDDGVEGVVEELWRMRAGGGEVRSEGVGDGGMEWAAEGRGEEEDRRSSEPEDEISEPPKEALRFNPGALKLDLSSSMLFKKVGGKE